MKKQIKRKSPIMFVLGTILVLYVLFLFVLVLWGFFTSVKATRGAFNTFRNNEFGFPEGLPWQWQWNNYSTVTDWIYVVNTVTMNGKRFKVRSDIIDMLKNTMFYAVGGAAVSTLVPCFVAYATSKTNFFFSKIFDAIVLVVMIVPIIGAYPSELQILNTLGIYDTWIGYYIQRAHCFSAYYLIFQATFRSIPYSFSEAAYVEGAGEYTVMFRVILPLAKTIGMTIFLIWFITIWNDYNTSILYMPTHPSLAYGIFYLVFLIGEREVQGTPMQMAVSFILFTPILIMFICFRKVLMQNLSMGGVKE